MTEQVAITLFLKKVNLNALKLCLTFHYNITGRSKSQVLFFLWQGIGLARTWHSAATANIPCTRAISSLGAYGRLGQDATNTAQQGVSPCTTLLRYRQAAIGSITSKHNVIHKTGSKSPITTPPE